MKNVLVTGVTRGIGRAIAELLLAEGYKVYGVYRQDSQAANDLAQAHGQNIELIQANLANKDAVGGLIDNLAGIQLDGIVNNAGVVFLNSWDKLNFEEWEETLAVNLTAPLRLVHGLRDNLKDKSSIVNIASVDGFCAAYNTVAYGVSKAGLINLTKSMAANLGPRGVRVNAIAPGWVETDMVEGTMPPESTMLTPLARNAQPEEIANVVSFLLSEKSSFINAETIAVDGGLTAVDYTLYKESQNEN